MTREGGLRPDDKERRGAGKITGKGLARTDDREEPGAGRMQRLLISGRVQGVFFRAFAKRKADELGIIGYARNLSTGDVEIVAEGRNMAEFIRAVSSGPDSAKVLKVESRTVQEDRQFSGFSII